MNTQREIKFRRLYEFGQNGAPANKRKWVEGELTDEGFKTPGFACWHRPLSPWVQYTGLRDKNRKEIYEGDVVKVEGDRYNDLGAHIQFTGYVIMEQAGWRLRNGTRGLSLCDHFSHSLSAAEHDVQFDDGEVIGNIHENPDLLP